MAAWGKLTYVLLVLYISRIFFLLRQLHFAKLFIIERQTYIDFFSINISKFWPNLQTTYLLAETLKFNAAVLLALRIPQLYTTDVCKTYCSYPITSFLPLFTSPLNFLLCPLIFMFLCPVIYTYLWWGHLVFFSFLTYFS